MPQAGPLNRLIYIETPTKSTDGYGQNVPDYVTVPPVPARANIKVKSGQQLALTQANTITAIATVQIKMRYRNWVRVGFHRLRYGELPQTETIGFDSLDDAAFETLTSGDFETMTSTATATTTTTDTGTQPIYYQINAIEDVDAKHIDMVLTCVTVPSA